MRMNNAAIGVFDSGVGGLTAVKELNRILPDENIVYLGDTARVPYGTRSKETIYKYAKQDINFLLSKNVKMIIVACGTVSSVMASQPIYNGDLPTSGVLIPAVQTACCKTKNKKIGVIGTPATIKINGYGKAIRAINPEIKVIGKACPMFVPLVENGYIGKDSKVSRLIAEDYLEVMKKEKVDTLILGCTHYPLLKDIIADIMGDGVTLISPGEEAAKYAAGVLSQKEMLNSGENKSTSKFYVTDSTDMFIQSCNMFLGADVTDSVEKCNLEDF